MNYYYYFDCKYKFGSVTVEATNETESENKAKEKIKNGAWCEGRCDKCRLKITR